jgi:DNA-3-methyladenine glycosylase II
MSNRIHTQADVTRAVRHLKRVDPILARIISNGNQCRVYRKRSSFESLVRIIIGQQLSTSAAGTIYDRVVGLFNGQSVSAEEVLRLTDDELLGAGVSRAKLRTLRLLADKVSSKEINLRGLARCSDQVILDKLTRIKGIGPWSVEMYLMFVLRSADVFPASDTGIINAIRRLYHSNGNRLEPERIASRWRPYRTVACWYLWQYLDS